MTVYTTNKYIGKDPGREVVIVDSQEAGIDLLRKEIGGIQPRHQYDEQYLDELNRLGIHVVFEEV